MLLFSVPCNILFSLRSLGLIVNFTVLVLLPLPSSPKSVIFTPVYNFKSSGSSVSKSGNVENLICTPGPGNSTNPVKHYFICFGNYVSISVTSNCYCELLLLYPAPLFIKSGWITHRCHISFLLLKVQPLLYLL